MTYVPGTWVDDNGSGTTGTPITAARMNNIENGIYALDLNGPLDVWSGQQVYDIGYSGQKRGGRQLDTSDFTMLLGLGTPVGLFNLFGTLNLGSAGTSLTNKGSVTLTKDIRGTASQAARFIGSTAQALYIADTGASDPYRIRTGSVGLWFRCVRRGVQQILVSKFTPGVATRGFTMYVDSDNLVKCTVNIEGGAQVGTVAGVTDVADHRWHFAMYTNDGSVARMYVDGALEGAVPTTGPMNSASSGPFNIGAEFADAATAATAPFFGDIDEVFVTPDVLNEREFRFLMATRVNHNLSVTPRSARVNLRQRRRGNLQVADFTATPKRFYIISSSLQDWGAQGVGLTSVGTAPKVIAGPDGLFEGAFNFDGAGCFTASDSLLPAGTSSRSFGVWFKTNSTSASFFNMIGWGTSVAPMSLSISSGQVLVSDGVTNAISPTTYNDGAWHLAIAVIDNADAYGAKKKLYIDGKLVAVDTALSGTIAAGASGFQLGRNAAATLYFPGSLSRGFVTDYAMAQDEVTKLFAKANTPSGGSLGEISVVPTLDEADLQQCIQGLDSTYVYFLGDVRKRISGRVASDGTITEMAGGDFRVVKTGTGVYSVFMPSLFFSSPPIVELNTIGGGVIANLSTPGVWGFGVTTTATTTGVAGDYGFSFTAEARGPIPSQHLLDLSVAA